MMEATWTHCDTAVEVERRTPIEQIRDLEAGGTTKEGPINLSGAFLRNSIGYRKRD